MNKKAVVVASCFLVSMPIFAKGLLQDYLMKTKRYSAVKNSENYGDFSGLWVGQCSKPLENLTLNIVQGDKYITIKIPSTAEEGFKFPLDQVKSKNVSTSNGSEYSLSTAVSIGMNRLELSSYTIGMGSSDNSTSSFLTSMEFSLVLENHKLQFIVDNYPDEIVCVLDKQG
jgi:hypothetical protein